MFNNDSFVYVYAFRSEDSSEAGVVCSWLPLTDHCNLEFKSLAEEMLFLYLSRGATAHCRLSLQTLAFIAHLARENKISYTSRSSKNTLDSERCTMPLKLPPSPRGVLNIRHSSAMSSGFFLPVAGAFLLSMESSP